MATIGTRLFTFFRGVLVGEDEFGNRYYRERMRPHEGRKRRWVIYKGEIDASRVPPSWHAWLHHSSDAAPSQRPPEVKDWEKPHLPNLTGTAEAYRPPGHVLSGGQRERATGDYEPWRPE